MKKKILIAEGDNPPIRFPKEFYEHKPSPEFKLELGPAAYESYMKALEMTGLEYTTKPKIKAEAKWRKGTNFTPKKKKRK